MPDMWRLDGMSPRDLVVRLWRAAEANELDEQAAQLAYYFLFALFPLLLFLTTLVGFLVEDPALRTNLLAYLGRVMPGQAFEVIQRTLGEVRAGRSGGQLGVGLLVAIIAASRGMLAVMGSLDAAFRVPRQRRFIDRQIVAVALTLVFGALLLSALTLILLGGSVGRHIAAAAGIEPIAWPAWQPLRWIAVILIATASFDLVYAWAPSANACRRPFTPGSVLAVTLWLIASVALQLYVAHFDSFTVTYGSLGGVIALLVWFYLTALALLLGGVLNALLCASPPAAPPGSGRGSARESSAPGAPAPPPGG